MVHIRVSLQGVGMPPFVAAGAAAGHAGLHPHQQQGGPHQQQGPRAFLYRDYFRRLRHLEDMLYGNRLDLQNWAAHLAGYQTRTLNQMLASLYMFSAPHIGLQDGSHRILLAVLEMAVRQRTQGLPANAADPFQPQLLVAPFVSPWVNLLPLNSILLEPQVSQLLPPGITQNKPFFVYKYNTPLHMSYSNYKAVAQLSQAEADQILASPCSCASTPALSPFLQPHGCVCTMDTSVVANPNAQAYLDMGRKYRPISSRMMHIGVDVRRHVFDGLCAAVNSFAQRMDAALHHLGGMSAWAALVRARISHYIQALPYLQTIGDFGEEVLKASQYVAHTLPGCLATFRQRIPILQQAYVFTYVDKAANNVCLICKKAYITLLRADLEQGAAVGPVDPAGVGQADPAQDPAGPPQGNPLQYYMDVTHMYASATVLAQTIQQQLQESGNYRCLDHDALQLPYYCGIVKFHKSPAQMRFLCCSSSIVLTSAGHYTTQFLRGIQQDLVQQWHAQLLQLGVPVPAEGLVHTPWMISASDKLLPVLYAFRNLQLPWSELVERKMQATLDFERLYTNLPQDDLILRLHRIVDDVFAMHEGAVAVAVYKQKGLPLKWLTVIPPQLCGKAKGQVFQVFTLASMQWLLSFLIQQTYVCFTGKLYHQIKGIPMGISPAVYISNYYLHTYEFDFLQQLIPMQAAGVRSTLHTAAIRHVLLQGGVPPGGPADVAALVLDSYTFTVRFLDDMYSLANPIRDHLLYVNQSWSGVRGLYPTALNLKLTAEGASVNYMDIRVVMSVKHVAQGMNMVPIADFETFLYSKHIDGPFKSLRLVRYPPITSMLAWQAKYNIITTEFHRLLRRVTNEADLCSNLGRIVVDLLRQGYQVSRLMRMLSRLFHQYGPGRLPGQPALYVREVARTVALLLHQYQLPGGIGDFLHRAGFL